MIVDDTNLSYLKPDRYTFWPSQNIYEAISWGKISWGFYEAMPANSNKEKYCSNAIAVRIQNLFEFAGIAW